MIKDYIIEERLGVGSYGTVYKVRKKNSNQLYVIKQISLLGLGDQQKNEYKLEASLLSSINSNYVVKYYTSFEETNNLNIVMEYCNGGDLFQFLEEKKKTKHLLSENLIWELFIKMILGLSAIHKMKILHRDLKSQNIFLTKNLEVKIGDLGVAKQLNQTNFAKTFIGTPYYLSPELCSEKPYNYKSDIWAIGCILYELCTYKHPFNAKSQGALILKILNSIPEKINQYYSRDLQKMIDLLLNKDYLLRPSCSDILKLPVVIIKAKKCNLFEEIVKNNPKNHFHIDLDSALYIQNKENNKERKSYEGEKASKKLINQNISNENINKGELNHKEKYKVNKNNEHYNLLEGHNSKKNSKKNNILINSSFIKYNSKYNNHFYYNSNNKRKNNKEKNIIKKDIINMPKNKNSDSKIIKKVITKIINKNNSNIQNSKNKKENHFIEMLNNALNEVNNKISYINKKEKRFLKNKNIVHEKSKTPSIKNIKKSEISIFNNFKIGNSNNNNIQNSKNEITGYSSKQIIKSQEQFYSKKISSTENRLVSQKSKENIKIEENKNENKINNKDNNSIDIIEKKNDKKTIKSNININKQKKMFDIQEFANNLNNYVNKYKTSEFRTLNKEHIDKNDNLIKKINNDNNFSNEEISDNLIKKDNDTIEEENLNNGSMNDSKNNVFEINIKKLDNNISNNNNFINNNINININNISNSKNGTINANNTNNNNILNSIMNFKIINNNDSDIHININNNSPIDSIKASKISIDSNTNSNIIMNNNMKNNSNSDEENEKGLYSEEENSEEQDETVQEIKENKNNLENMNLINLNNNENINDYMNKLIEEKNTINEKINLIKDDMLALIGGTDYNYIINIYNNTDNENENVDEIYEKIEKFVNLHYDEKKKESFDNLYYTLIALDCQLVEKEKKLKSINY